MRITFVLNGKETTVEAPENEILLDTLRYGLGIRSVKRGCETGECGACTVLVDEKPVYSCMLLTPMVNGRTVTTVEDLYNDPLFKEITMAFMKHGAVQCGFCTPGFTLTAYALIKSGVEPTWENIAKAIEGNLCRCTGYKKIIEAIMEAAKNYYEQPKKR